MPGASAFMGLAVLTVVLIVAGCGVGLWMRRSRWWWLGFCGPMVVIALVGLGRRSLAAGMVAPVSWLVHPWICPEVMGFCVTALLLNLSGRLRVRRQRAMVVLLMWAMVVYYALLPMADPWLARSSLGAVRTKVNREGICIQSRSYTCGPAAAVTCLRRLGVAGQEGPLAIAAGTGQFEGTDPHLLAEAVGRLYGGEGVRARYVVASRLEEVQLPAACMMAMPVQGHFVAVLQIGAKGVLVGDPISGGAWWPRRVFDAYWRGGAVEIGRAE